MISQYLRGRMFRMADRLRFEADRLRFELRNAFASPVFKTGAFNRSAICPLCMCVLYGFKKTCKVKNAIFL